MKAQAWALATVCRYRSAAAAPCCSTTGGQLMKAMKDDLMPSNLPTHPLHKCSERGRWPPCRFPSVHNLFKTTFTGAVPHSNFNSTYVIGLRFILLEPSSHSHMCLKISSCDDAVKAAPCQLRNILLPVMLPWTGSHTGREKKSPEVHTLIHL